jgi:cytochrome oxidase assembly protein ShyY1
VCSVFIARPSLRCRSFVWHHQDRLRRAETARDGASADLVASAAKAEDLATQLASAEEGLRHAEQALMDAQDRVQHYKVTWFYLSGCCCKMWT